MPKPQTHIAPPSASSGSGTRFEWMVGAFYLLSMLAEGEPRGLPGARIKSVKFQQRIAGKPLDDVVVEAVNRDGTPATIEIQCKLALDFTASDKQFQDVVGQLWEASQSSDFGSQRYELAVAIAKTSTRIEREYQEVLHWARELGSAPVFFDHLGRNGFASEGSRRFVAVLRDNLDALKLPNDDGTVWRILRRFQILVFDFTAPGSSYEHRAHERALSLLASEEAARARDLWAGLIDMASANATAAGDRLDRASLVRELNEKSGLLVAPTRSVGALYEKLEEDSRFALAGIDDTVGGQRLSRSELVGEVLDELERHRVVHISGAPGAGKSHLLKQLAQLAGTEGRIIVLGNGRIFGGGWRRMAEAYSCQLSLSQLLNELGSGGGATLFVDNVDQIESAGERATLLDLIGTARVTPGWSIVTTGGEGRDDWRTGLGLLATEVGTVVVGQIGDKEAQQLAAANPSLGIILAKGHPAERLARNLFYLARLVELSSGKETIRTELDLARLWWNYAGGRRADAGSIARKIAIRKLAKALIEHPENHSVELDDFDPNALTELLATGALREDIRGATIAFRHDVLRDWAIGFVIQEGRLLQGLRKADPLPISIARGVEMSVSLMLDQDETGTDWLQALRSVRSLGNDPSWLRPILLPLPRCAGAYDRLVAVQAALLDDEGEMLRELLRLMLALDAEPVTKYAARTMPDLPPMSGLSDIVLPKDPSWFAIIAWMIVLQDQLPARVLPEVVRLLRGWLIYCQGATIDLNGALVAFAFKWLAIIDEAVEPRSFRKGEPLPPPLAVPNIEHARDALQMTAFLFANLNADAADAYLVATLGRRVRYNGLQPFVKQRANLAKAAPKAYVDLLVKVLIDDELEDEWDDGRHSSGPFLVYDSWFTPPSPSQGPFLELLQTDPAQGLRLIRALVQRTMVWRAGGRLEHLSRTTIELDGIDHEFLGGYGTYLWSRSSPSSIITSALMAVEAWGHLRIEDGASFDAVMLDVLGPSGSSIAFLAVAVDLMLSHWAASQNWAWSLCASSKVVEYNEARHLRDASGSDRIPAYLIEPTGPVSRADLEARPSRRIRIVDGISYFAQSAPLDVRDRFADAVRKEADSVLPPEEPDPDEVMGGRYAIAQRSLRMLDPDNWVDEAGQDDQGNPIQLRRFMPTEDEQAAIAARRKEAAEEEQLLLLRAKVQSAFLDPSKSSPELVVQAIDWAKAQPIEPEVGPDGSVDFETGWNRRIEVMAAVLAVRDLPERGGTAVSDWAEAALLKAARIADNEYRADVHVEYNRNAIAAVGLVDLYFQRPTIMAAGCLLRLATHEHPPVHSALGRAFPRFAKHAPQLLRAILRLTIECSVYSADRDDDEAKQRVAVENAISRELAALEHGGDEPQWPDLPRWPVRKRRGVRIGRRRDLDDEDGDEDDVQPDLLTDQDRLSTMMNNLVPVTAVGVETWMVELAMRLLDWAIDANGRGRERYVDNRPISFNYSFFDFLGVLAVALPSDRVIAQFIAPIAHLEDEPFHDAASEFLRGFDRATLAPDTKNSDAPVAIRAAIIARIVTTRNYERTKNDLDLSTETHAASAYKALFFMNSNPMTPATPIVPPSWPGLPEIVPSLSAVVTGAPGSGCLAYLFLLLIDTSPSPALLPSVIGVASSWCAQHGSSDAFWLGNGFGGRLVEWFGRSLRERGPELPKDMVASLRACFGVLVRTGVAGIADLETMLTSYIVSQGRA